jgi:hypothetical protein
MSVKIRWLGYAGHWILADRCQFHLTTRVGRGLVSTVGTCIDPTTQKLEPVRKWRREKWYFETMVFRAGAVCSENGCGCGVPKIDGLGLDVVRTKTAGEATLAHNRMIRKWSQLRGKP